MCASVYLSHSSETPKLPQRIIDALKSYIYTPEEGKGWSCVVWLCLLVIKIKLKLQLLPFQTAFRFPLKLAISAVVSCITLYQVRAISMRLSAAHGIHLMVSWLTRLVDVFLSSNSFIFIWIVLGESSPDLGRGAAPPDCPFGSRWRHRQRFSWLQDYAGPEQTGSGQNSGLLHLVCRRWVTPERRSSHLGIWEMQNIHVFIHWTLTWPLLMSVWHIYVPCWLSINDTLPQWTTYMPCAPFPAVCYSSAMTLSCLINLAMLMRSMVLHR